VNPAEFAQQLLRSLVEDGGEHQPDFDDEISTSSVAAGERSAFAQSEPLPRLGARRDPQARRPLRGLDLHPSSECGVMNGNRHDSVKVVTVAVE
jgi:hypothetical protein